MGRKGKAVPPVHIQDMGKSHLLPLFLHLDTTRTTLIQEYFLISSATLLAGVPSHGAIWAPFPLAHTELCFQFLYYTNTQLLLLFQLNGQCIRTCRTLVIIHCSHHEERVLST